MPLGFEDKAKFGSNNQAGAEALGTAWFAWSDAQGRPSPAPEAWAGGWLKLSAGGRNWGDLSLQLEDQALPLLMLPGGGLLAQWPAMPAGYCRLSLKQADTEIAAARVFVGTAQLDAARWRALLRDLRYRLPTRLLIRFAACGGRVPVRPGALPADPEEELALLLPLLEAGALPWALRWLAGRAHRAAALTGLWQPLYRVRRPEPRELARRLSRGRLNASSPVWELRPQLSLDQPENRFVAGSLQSLLQHLDELGRYLRHSGQSALATRLTGPAAELRALWHAHPLAQLPGRSQPPANHHLLREPAYAICYEAWRLLHQGMLPATASRRELPYADLALLYQHWCLLRVAEALLSWAQAQGFRPNGQPPLRPLLRRGLALLDLSKGETRLRLIPEASYGPAGRLISLSRAQRPDISLLLEAPQQPPRLWVLDAKFRSRDGEPLKDDLDKLHAYRDAIRHADGSPVVERAVLLYPGTPRRYGSAIAAWQLLPGDEPELGIDDLLGPGTSRRPG